MTKPLRLHTHDLSGHSHRVELFLSLLGVPYEKVFVDLMKGAQKTPEFLALNPRGQIPVVEDGDVVLADSNAILVYLALRYDPAGTWYPQDAVTAARIQRWFSLAAGELVTGPGNARLVKLLGAKFDLEQAHRGAALLFGLMETVLAASPFLVSASPTLADLSLYSYTAVANEGDVSLESYPAVRAWLRRLEALPGFLPMSRVKSVG